jgi:hypothetical protein
MGYIAWSGISVIGLGSPIYIWLTLPDVAIHAGYGLGGSIAVLALSILVVAVATAVIFVRRVPGRARSAVAAMLLVAVGAGIVPVGIIDLLHPGSATDATYILLANPAIGMVVLAVAVIRTPLKEDHDRGLDTESRAYRELLRRSAETDRHRTG